VRKQQEKERENDDDDDKEKESTRGNEEDRNIKIIQGIIIMMMVAMLSLLRGITEQQRKETNKENIIKPTRSTSSRRIS